MKKMNLKLRLALTGFGVMLVLGIIGTAVIGDALAILPRGLIMFIMSVFLLVAGAAYGYLISPYASRYFKLSSWLIWSVVAVLLPVLGMLVFISATFGN